MFSSLVVSQLSLCKKTESKFGCSIFPWLSTKWDTTHTQNTYIRSEPVRSINVIASVNVSFVLISSRTHMYRMFYTHYKTFGSKHLFCDAQKVNDDWSLNNLVLQIFRKMTLTVRNIRTAALPATLTGQVGRWKQQSTLNCKSAISN